MHVLVTRRPNSVVKKGQASLWCLKSDRTAIPLVNDLEFIKIFFIKGTGKTWIVFHFHQWYGVSALSTYPVSTSIIYQYEISDDNCL